MEVLQRPPQPVAARLPAPRLAVSGPAAGAWLLGFAPVAYLAFANGGYETIVRNQVGVAVWWIVLVAAAAGLVSARIPAPAWVGIGLLTAFVVWTALASGWSESAERSVTEMGKVATYLGILVLAVAVQGRTAARHAFFGVASAIAVVGCAAALARLHPGWFPVNDQVRVLGVNNRLSYPLNYWNALAAFLGMGIPLLLAAGAMARRIAVQAVAVALVPVLVLAIYFTISRGGVLAVGVGVVVLLLLAEDRLARLVTVLLAGAGSAILIAAAHARTVIESNDTTAAAQQAGDEML